VYAGFFERISSFSSEAEKYDFAVGRYGIPGKGFW
jgi:hypothetical protein